MRLTSLRLRALSRCAVAALMAGALAGCQTTAQNSALTGPMAARAEIPPAGQSQTAIEALGERYRANPKDVEAALRYGNALRANGQYVQAAAVLEAANLATPGNKQLLALYGRTLVDTGQFQQALDTLALAHSPAAPDWRVLSVQGTALDQLGRHEEARRYYASALKIVPNEPTVLSNLGMSYVLTKDLPRAESLLRQAYASPNADARVRQNLALVVGLQGRFSEAETIARADLPPEQAAANAAYLRQMLAQSAPGAPAAPARAARPS